MAFIGNFPANEKNGVMLGQKREARLRAKLDVPGIHVFLLSSLLHPKNVDGRDKPGHDDCGLRRSAC
jgi:hypothetical protein